VGRIIVVLLMLAFAVAGCFGDSAASHLSQSGISPEGSPASAAPWNCKSTRTTQRWTSATPR